MRPRTFAPIIVLFAVLALLNLAIFRRQYALGYGFPWDFNYSYHAVPAYWIEAMRHGAGTAWIPFQGMGYATYLNLQSGIDYPPLRAFAWLDLPYTLHAAVVLQCLHVFAGGLGAAFCARLMGLRWPAALFAGVAWQCFGGFYAHSS